MTKKFSNPAFIVDGYTELLIMQKICPGKPVKRSDINGKDVTIEAIAKKISSIIRALGNRHYPIVILVDKEKRNISFEKMADELLQGLRANGIDDDIRIGVADIMIENWIVADWYNLTGKTSGKPVKINGVNGASLIKKEKKQYGKTTDGVTYFLNSDPKIIYKESPSFKNFVDKISDIDCNFLSAVH